MRAKKYHQIHHAGERTQSTCRCCITVTVKQCKQMMGHFCHLLQVHLWPLQGGDFLKTCAPGEARTLDLRISMSILTYKYDALTDCATGAEPVSGV